MKKSQIIEQVAKASNQPMGDTTLMFDAFVAIVGETLRAGEKVTISGFGTFLPSPRKAKEGVHPLDSSQRIHIPAHVVPRFRASEQLHQKVR